MTGHRHDGLSLARIRKVRDAAADGCTFNEIAGAASIHPTTLKEWIRRGEAGQPGYRAILPAVYSALSRKRRKRRKQIETAAIDDWRAAAHLDAQPIEDIEVEAFKGMTRTELVAWAASHPEVIALVLERHARQLKADNADEEVPHDAGG